MKFKLELNTNRLKLTELCMADLPAIAAYRCDAEDTKYLGRAMKDEAAVAAFIEYEMVEAQMSPRRRFFFSVSDVADGHVGMVWLKADDNVEQAGIGWIFDKRVRGKGYATEAARRMIGFGFRELGLHRIYADCFKAAAASCRVAEKCGMRLEATTIKSAFYCGEWLDDCEYAILAEEWGQRD